MNRNILFFCTDTDIGVLRQPVDGNPYKNAAVLASGTKVRRTAAACANFRLGYSLYKDTQIELLKSSVVFVTVNRFWNFVEWQLFIHRQREQRFDVNVDHSHKVFHDSVLY